jgi:seryl-tRNA synthetase
MHWRLQGNEMIKHVTEKEPQLSNMLHTCSEALKQVTAERDKLAAELKALRDSDVALPDHPEPQIMIWTQVELEAIRDYGDRRAMAERERAAKVCESRSTPGTGSVAILLGAAEEIRKGEK